MEMPPQPRKKGAVMAKVKNVLFMVGMVLVASMVLHSSAQSLALVLFGHDASATVQVYKVQRDYDTESIRDSYRVTEQYTLWVDGEQCTGGLTFSTPSPDAELKAGEIRQESVRYWPKDPSFNEPASRASFQSLGVFGSIRLVALPLMILALAGFVIYKKMSKTAVAPPKNSGPGWLEKLMEPFGITRGG